MNKLFILFLCLNLLTVNAGLRSTKLKMSESKVERHKKLGDSLTDVADGFAFQVAMAAALAATGPPKFSDAGAPCPEINDPIIPDGCYTGEIDPSTEVPTNCESHTYHLIYVPMAGDAFVCGDVGGLDVCN